MRHLKTSSNITKLSQSITIQQFKYKKYKTNSSITIQQLKIYTI